MYLPVYNDIPGKRNREPFFSHITQVSKRCHPDHAMAIITKAEINMKTYFFRSGEISEQKADKPEHKRGEIIEGRKGRGRRNAFSIIGLSEVQREKI